MVRHGTGITVASETLVWPIVYRLVSPKEDEFD
jgi:hypothetical protein